MHRKTSMLKRVQAGGEHQQQAGISLKQAILHRVATSSRRSASLCSPVMHHLACTLLKLCSCIENLRAPPLCCSWFQTAAQSLPTQSYLVDRSQIFAATKSALAAFCESQSQATEHRQHSILMHAIANRQSNRSVLSLHHDPLELQICMQTNIDISRARHQKIGQ